MSSINLVLIIIASVFDGKISTFLILCSIFILGMLFSLFLSKGKRILGFKLFEIVYFAYVLSALIVSTSFSASDNFMLSDASRYIENYMHRTQLYFDSEDFYDCYFQFSDSNLLYNFYLNVAAMFANKSLDGLSVYGMTLLQTGWGVLSSIVLFRILARHVRIERAYRYTLVFLLCSMFLFYSIVIVRDIIICFLYLCAFNIIDKKFSWLGVINLLLLIFLTWGIRLYSGVFLFTFLAYYLYLRFRKSRLKSIATILFLVVVLFAVSGMMTSSLMEQTTADLQHNEELSAERSAGGLVSTLLSLPPGISQLAIVLFTMIRPLPPLGIYVNVETFSHFIMATICLVAGFFWFVVFYSLCYKLFVKKCIFKIPFENIIFLAICMVFLLAAATHPDIRRMLPVFPVLFVQYVVLCEKGRTKLFSSIESKMLIVIYIALAIVLLFFM